jgi:RimJ/RimL family protein N-acetyltransferase
MSALLIPSIRLFPTWKPAGGVTPVALRQIRPDDAAVLRGFVRALSPASRRLRFHAALNELPEATLQALTCVDQRGHVAFVLTVTEHGTERIVGEARYAVSSDEETAEFAIAVVEAFRGLGLAERLLAALIDAARAAGLRWLVGEVLAGNARMLAFMRRCGFAATTCGGLAPGLVRVERSVDRSLPVAQAAGSWTGIARRRVRRLLHELLPSPREAGSVFQPF